MRGLLVVVVALALAATLAGCLSQGQLAVPRLGFRQLHTDDPAIFQGALRAAAASGHMPLQIDPARGSFAVQSNDDPRHEIRFAVQCYRDGWVTVVPVGIEEHEGRFALPRVVGDEYARLAMALETTLAMAIP